MRNKCKHKKVSCIGPIPEENDEDRYLFVHWCEDCGAYGVAPEGWRVERWRSPKLATLGGA